MPVVRMDYPKSARGAGHAVEMESGMRGPAVRKMVDIQTTSGNLTTPTLPQTAVGRGSCPGTGMLNWEPVFPSSDRLVLLNPEKAYVPFDEVNNYDKRSKSPGTRRSNGWTKHGDRGELHSREKLISDILCRWWYVFPQWPSKDFSYTEELRKRGHYECKIEDWLTAAPVVNGDGLAKAYQLFQFPGIFRDTDQNKLDLRPAQNCPCFVNLQSQTTQTLCKFVTRAYENQIACLRQVGGYKKAELIATLEKELKMYMANSQKWIKKYDDPKDDYMKQLRKRVRKFE